MSIKTAFSVRDISPLRPMALYGYPHVERMSTGIHDPLLSSVAVLRNATGATIVLVSLDILMIGPAFARELRRSVASAIPCAEENVMISCTHTHSGPVTSRLIGWGNDPTIPPVATDYLAFLKEQTVAAASEAVQSLTEAELAWASADATGVGGNRLARGGLTDPECGLLLMRDASTRRTLGMAMIYGMHPTVMHEDSTLVSSDFPYYTRLQIQEHLGAAVPILYHTAPAGNQSPRHFVNGQTFEEAERLGRLLGTAACKAIDAISPEDWHGDADLAGRLCSVELPRNPIRPLVEAEALLAEYQANYRRLQEEGAPRAEVRTAECAIFGAEGTLALAQSAVSGELENALGEYRTVDVQILQIGNVILAGLPGESFTEYALDIKHHAPMKTFVISLVNGELQGYIVTPEAAAKGGYEATNAIFAPASGKILEDAVLSLIKETANEDS